MTAPGRDDELPPSDTDWRFVERQIRTHVDLAQWKPDPYVFEATPDRWRRAFQIAHLQRDGVRDVAEMAERLGVDERLVEEDKRLVPYLDRTIAGLLSVLGWYVDTNF